ncbi:MAG TPA: AI-2E family transporter [Steroidobacteraceae bacterium]|jgi:predicted PurR-regulated permease PerM
MPEANPSVAQKIARYILIGLLILLGGWMLRHFLPALCWAVVLAIATSPIYDRWLARLHGRWRHIIASLSFTTFLGIILIVPIVYGGFVAVREGISLVHQFADATRNGPLELPQWLQQIPWVGDWLNQQVAERFGDAAATADVVSKARPTVFEFTRALSTQVFRRLVTLVFTLLTLYFVYLNRDSLQAQVPRVSERLFGPKVTKLLHRAVDAIRATVDGIVLVAVAEGAVMCAVYAIAGAPHPILFGAITGIFAMIPFAAPVAFGAIALLMFTQGAVGAGIGILIAGTVVLFIADHFVRPAIIGGGARLPFLWVLLGILGGVESFGLVGIFLGPALMAALVSLWRSWVADSHGTTDDG